MARRKKETYYNDRVFAAPSSDEERITQLRSLNFDLIEYRLRHGLSTASEIVSLLNLGTEEKVLQREEIRERIDLMASKKTQIESQTEIAQMMRDGFAAFGSYVPGGGDDDGTDPTANLY